MSIESRKEYLARMIGRYSKAGKRYKTRILDEVCEVCGYERKYAIKLLNDTVSRSSGKRIRWLTVATEPLNIF